MTREKPRALMATAVWGDWYINAHLTANLRTLLADGNLPELTRRYELTYRVYTGRSDVTRIMSSPAMQEISRLMPVEVEILSEQRLADPIATHQWAWGQATSYAKESGRFVLFMPPDVAWADKSFAHVADLLTAGKKAIFMTYLRVVSETFVPALQKCRKEAEGVIALAGRDMVALALQHLHPLMAAHCHDSPYFPSHSEMILWPVRNEGMLVRVLAREMFLYDPTYIEMTKQLLVGGTYDPREMVFVNDSDNLFAISLAPLGKDVSWHMEYRKATSWTLGRWWLGYDSPLNDFIAGTCIRWHTGVQTAKAWRRQEIKSNRLVRDATAVREGMRIWRVINDMGCQIAATMLALVTGGDLLAKAISSLSPAVIFVPSDDALRLIPEERRHSFAEPRNVHRLIALLRHHVVLDADACAFDGHGLRNPVRLELKTAAGHPLTVERVGERLTVNEFEILGQGRRTGRYTIYQINGILDPSLATPAASRA